MRPIRLEVPPDVAAAGWVITAVEMGADGIVHVQAQHSVPFRCALSDDRIAVISDYSTPVTVHAVPIDTESR